MERPNPQRWRLVAWVLSLLARLFTGLTRKGRARSLRAFLSRMAGSQLSGTIAKSMLVHSSAITNRLRTYGTDYEQVAQKYPENDPLDRFFGEGASRGRSFSNRQQFD